MEDQSETQALEPEPHDPAEFSPDEIGGIERIFSRNAMTLPRSPVILPPRSMREREISGHLAAVAQPDDVALISTLTTETEHGVSQEYYDSLLKYPDFNEPQALADEVVLDFPARLTALQGVSAGVWDYAFYETRLVPGTQLWVQLINGRTSTYAGNQFGRAARNSREYPGDVVLIPQALNDVVLIHEVRAGGYRRFWFEGIAPQSVFAVRVTQTSGFAGNQTLPCTYVYTVKDITGTTTLLTNATPIKKRMSIGKYIAPDPNSIGLAIRDDANGIQLWDPNEILDPKAC